MGGIDGRGEEWKRVGRRGSLEILNLTGGSDSGAPHRTGDEVTRTGDRTGDEVTGLAQESPPLPPPQASDRPHP